MVFGVLVKLLSVLGVLFGEVAPKGMVRLGFVDERDEGLNNLEKNILGYILDNAINF